MLKIAALLNFLLALGHLLCMFFLDTAFKFYGIDGVMNDISAQYGAATPYIVTVIIAAMFFAAGLYALSCDCVIRKLPLLNLGMITIICVFLFRAVSGIVTMISHSNFSIAGASSVLVALIIGMLYLLGYIHARKQKSHR